LFMLALRAEMLLTRSSAIITRMPEEERGRRLDLERERR